MKKFEDMTLVEKRQYWATIENKLRAFIANVARVDFPDQKFDQIYESLDHNELGLAWEDIKAVYDSNNQKTPESLLIVGRTMTLI